MKITKIGVEYKELKSSGYPSFSNTTYGVVYEAEVLESEDKEACRRDLMAKAIKDVKQLHGENMDGKKIKISIIPETQELPW